MLLNLKKIHNLITYIDFMILLELSIFHFV